MKKQQGFTMMEIGMALVILSILYWGWVQISSMQTWKAAMLKDGAHLAELAKSMNAMASANSMILSNKKNIYDVRALVAAGTWPAWKREIPRIGDGTPVPQDGYLYSKNTADLSTPPGDDIAQVCQDDHRCAEITVKNLRDWGFLPETFPDKSPAGYSFRIIARKYTFPGQQEPAILATIATTKPILHPTKRVALSPGQEDLAFDSAGAYTMADRAGPWGGVVRVFRADQVAKIPASIAAQMPADLPSAGNYVAVGPGDPMGWLAKASHWPNITDPGQVVALAGFWGKDRDTFLCTDGCNSMTTDLKMGENALIDLKKVAPGAACDGADPKSAASSAMAGRVVTIDPAQAGGVAGYTLSCIQQALPGGSGDGYVWSTSPGVPTVGDMRAGGLFLGLETPSADLCLGSLIPVTNPPPAPISGQEVPVKFVIGKVNGQQGVAGLYYFFNGQWNLAYTGAVDGIKYQTNAFFKVYSEVNKSEFCTSAGPDPLQIAPLNGIRGTAYITFSPTIVTYKATGVFARTVSNPTTNQGLVQNQGGPRTVTINEVTGVACDPMTGACNVSTLPVQKSVDETAAADRVVDQRIATNPGQTVVWQFSKRGSKCVDTSGTFVNPCVALTDMNTHTLLE